MRGLDGAHAVDEYLNVRADQPRVAHRSLATGFDRRYRPIETVTSPHRIVVPAMPSTVRRA
jgi:hypothetical protein